MTSKFSHFDEEVLAAAEAWAARLRSDQADIEDEHAFALWLGQSSQHGEAFDQVLQLWEAMGSAPMSNPDSLRTNQSAEIRTLPLRHGAAKQPPKRAPTLVPGRSYSAPEAGAETPKPKAKAHKSKRRPWLNATAFAALAATALVLSLVLLTRFENPAGAPQQAIAYETRVGTQGVWELEDGSRIELNTNSAVEVRFGEAERLVILRRGEAFFDVAPDSDRPFTVRTNSGFATVLGTAFNVKADESLTTVTVTEGLVRIAGLNSSGSRIAEAGQFVRVATDSLGLAEAADTQAATAWRNKTLIFRNTELTQAIEELNRYLSQPVDASDPSLADLRVSGTFSVEDPETTLNAIIETFGLQSASHLSGRSQRLYR